MIYIITDTHFGHQNLVERGAREDGFEAEILLGLQKFEEGDIVIHLGDVCFGRDQYWNDLVTKKLARNGALGWLIRGNHDQKSIPWYLQAGWDFAGDMFLLEYKGKKIVFTHKPIKKEDWWDINIHGHFHNSTHRLNDPELGELITPHHKLIAIENTDYKPVTLDSCLK